MKISHEDAILIKKSICQRGVVHEGRWVNFPTVVGNLEASVLYWRESERLVGLQLLPGNHAAVDRVRCVAKTTLRRWRTSCWVSRTRKTHRNKNAPFFGNRVYWRVCDQSCIQLPIWQCYTLIYNLLKLYATSVCVVCCVVAFTKTPEIVFEMKFSDSAFLVIPMICASVIYMLTNTCESSIFLVTMLLE